MQTFIVDSVGGISGSLTKLVDGTSYLVAGNNVTITSQSNGSVLIDAASAGSSADPRFGDGADGAAVFDGSSVPAGSTKNSSTQYTLNRDVFYSSMDIHGSVEVKANGFRVFCNASAIVSGTLSNNGNAGATPAPGAATTGTGTLGSSVAGGGGTNSGFSQTGNSVTCSYGGAGGYSGNHTATGGSVTGPAASRGSVHSTGAMTAMLGAIFGSGGWTLINGGAGGAGSNAGITNGGGGGAGGGVVVLAAHDLLGTGSIAAKGGDGGLSDNNGDWSAGGGGGGVIILATTDTGSWSGQLDVSGGISPTANVFTGGPGDVGSAFVFML